MSGTFVIYGKQQLSHLADLLNDGPIKIDWKRFSKRSNPQNALFHMWCSEIAQHFVAGGKHEFTNGDRMNMENVKENLKHTFLGSIPTMKTNMETGEVDIQHETKSSAALSKSEMLHFLDLIRNWAMQFDIVLTIPHGSDYHEYLMESGEIAA